MSPNAVNDVAASFVQMARAFEELPGVKEALDNEMAENDTKSIIIQRLETKLMDAKNLEETLRQSIRDLEVARDDAELRFLELEETANMVRRVLNDIADSSRNQANQLTRAVEKPAAAEPAKFDDGGPYNEPTISEVKPIAADPIDATPNTMEASVVSAPSVDSVTDQGQSDPLPTSALPAPTGTGTESVASYTDPEPVRYDPDTGWTTSDWWAWKDRQA